MTFNIPILKIKRKLTMIKNKNVWTRNIQLPRYKSLWNESQRVVFVITVKPTSLTIPSERTKHPTTRGIDRRGVIYGHRMEGREVSPVRFVVGDPPTVCP